MIGHPERRKPQAFPLWVILSGENACVFVVEVLRSEWNERSKTEDAKHPKGSTKAIRYPTTGKCYFPYEKPSKLLCRSLRRYRSSVFDRLATGCSSHKNFDYGLRPSLRMTDRAALCAPRQNNTAGGRAVGACLQARVVSHWRTLWLRSRRGISQNGASGRRPLRGLIEHRPLFALPFASPV